MRRACTVFAVVSIFVAGCGGGSTTSPLIQTGPGAVVSADGLHRVDNVPNGVLLVRPNYGLDSYDEFEVGEVVVTLKRGSEVLDKDELERVKARYVQVVRDALTQLDRAEVAERGPCVVHVNLALVDLNLERARSSAGSSVSMVGSLGAVTLLIEFRDSQTGEALLRYARRRSIEGATFMGPTPGAGSSLKRVLKEFAEDFQADVTHTRDRVVPVARATTCAERAGLEAFTPEVDAQQEIERALAKSPDVENGRLIYGGCAQCHEPEGWGRADGTVPQLAGQHRNVVIKQLADIRAGNRGNLMMYAFASEARIGGAQAVADVAAYIDTLEITSETGKGPGDDLERGESLFVRDCVRCHGPRGEGDGERFLPRIQSQHFAYLVRQFEWIRDGRRRNADPEMRAQIQGYSTQEAHAVLDYVSRLEASASVP